MLRVERSVVVNAPLATVAAFLAEPTNFAKLDRKVRGMKIVERRPGRALVEIRGLFGGFFPYWMQFAMETQPNGGLTIYQVKGPARSFDASFALSPAPGGGTRVTHVEAFAFYNLIPNLAERLARRYVERVVEEELRRLARFVGPDAPLELPWD